MSTLVTPGAVPAAASPAVRTSPRTVDLTVYDEVDQALPLDVRLRLRLVLALSTLSRSLGRTGRR